MKARTATITFHASHNYGSMLQAYALQQAIIGRGIDNEIINFRSRFQKRMYCHPLHFRKMTWKHTLWGLAHRILYPQLTKDLVEKYNLFESFIENELCTTKEFTSEKELVEISDKYSSFITGSDQCWNTESRDFSWAYYLDFTRSDRKISYASSIGSARHSDNQNEIRRLLMPFRKISVRDGDTKEYMQEITGKDIDVLPDPTFLLPKSTWENFSGTEALIGHPYIFVYTPYSKKGVLELANTVAEIIGLPLLITNLTDPFVDMKLQKDKRVIYKLDVGPKEFVNIVNHAEMVICGSFHALAFSVIMNTPFWVVNGDKDIRTRQILDLYGFSDRSISIDNISGVDLKKSISFDNSNRIIEAERRRALKFLTDNITD